MRLLFIIDPYTIDPLGIAYLSAYLKDAGHEVDISHTGDEDCDILCYSVTTGKHQYYLDLNRKIKGDRLSLFGGTHCTFFPAMQHEPGVDAIVRGEGFGAIVDIANGLRLDDILNVNDNPLRHLVNKDTLPLPDRELIYKFPENYNNPIKNLMCSFGCMMNCPYCYASKYRELYDCTGAEMRSPENVMVEVEDLCKYPLELIYFQDDIFPVYNKAWIDRFVALYGEFNMPFHIQVRIEMLDEDTLLKLKSVGLHGLTFAIETGNEIYRHDVLKRNISNQAIVDKAGMLHRHNTRFRVENMIGLPQETLEMLSETIMLNQQIAPTYAWASIFHPYPGTELGDECCVDTDSDFFHDVQNKQIDRLQKLFALAVAMKLPIYLIKWLSKLNISYQYIHDIIKHISYKRLYNVELD
jgi:radical SAM superfamily enzyme YgiQ (UPF0313 family)